MPISRKDKDNDLGIVNPIHEAMLFGKLTTPTSFWLTLQWFRVTQACFRMCLQFVDESLGLCKYLGLIFGELEQIFISPRRIYNLISHSPFSSNTLTNLPLEAFHDTRRWRMPVRPLQAFRRTLPSSLKSGQTSRPLPYGVGIWLHAGVRSRPQRLHPYLDRPARSRHLSVLHSYL